MKPSTVAALEREFRNRASSCGANLAAEAAWLSAADLLTDAAKQDRYKEKKELAAKKRRQKSRLTKLP